MATGGVRVDTRLGLARTREKGALGGAHDRGQLPLRRGDYDRLFSDWRRIVRGKATVALRHRLLLEQTLGRGATRRRIARAVRKAGAMRGGVVGRVLFAGGWLVGGFDRATD